MNIPELMNLNNKVLKNSAKIIQLTYELPDFVVEPYFKKLTINEAQSNNEIEGVKSTKKELTEALTEFEKSEPKNKRFIGLIKTYLHMDKIPSFENIYDFRTLYDELVSKEISRENKQDGNLFRKGYVEVNNGVTITYWYKRRRKYK